MFNRARRALEAVIAEIDAQIIDLQILLSGFDASKPLDPAVADKIVTVLMDELRPRLDRASGIINASGEAVPCRAANEAAASLRAQDAVDQLFS